ncbi:hypothetical protein TNCV_4580431 [Trichonephila clavipes]|nr:hypothetical protein TNCV_4580431 [Trichonephila clavipes]
MDTQLNRIFLHGRNEEMDRTIEQNLWLLVVTMLRKEFRVCKRVSVFAVSLWKSIEESSEYFSPFLVKEYHDTVVKRGFCNWVVNHRCSIKIDRCNTKRTSPGLLRLLEKMLMTGPECLRSHLYRIGIADTLDCTLWDSGHPMTAEHLDMCLALINLNSTVKKY